VLGFPVAGVPGTQHETRCRFSTVSLESTTRTRAPAAALALRVDRPL
jgi:hypothetical protein